MQTPWGDLPVSDAHVHFFSQPFFAALAAQKGVPVEAIGAALHWQLPLADPAQLADHWRHELHSKGVDRCALIASVPGDGESVEAAVARHPQQFRAYMMVNPLSAQGLDSVTAALTGGNVHGICLFPAMHGYSLHDERCMRVVELAAARPGMVVFVHTGVLSVGVRRKLGLPSLFDMRFSNPIDLHAIALRYPHTNFVLPHFGAGYFREALMVADLCPNVWFDTSSSNVWIRYEGLELRTVFERSLEILGPERLVFGSDSSFFPRGWNQEIFDVQSKALYETGLKAEAARMIFHDNFARLFG